MSISQMWIELILNAAGQQTRTAVRSRSRCPMGATPSRWGESTSTERLSQTRAHRERRSGHHGTGPWMPDNTTGGGTPQRAHSWEGRRDRGENNKKEGEAGGRRRQHWRSSRQTAESWKCEGQLGCRSPGVDSMLTSAETPRMIENILTVRQSGRPRMSCCGPSDDCGSPSLMGSERR